MQLEIISEPFVLAWDFFNVFVEPLMSAASEQVSAAISNHRWVKNIQNTFSLRGGLVFECTKSLAVNNTSAQNLNVNKRKLKTMLRLKHGKEFWHKQDGCSVFSAMTGTEADCAGKQPGEETTVWSKSLIDEDGDINTWQAKQNLDCYWPQVYKKCMYIILTFCSKLKSLKGL